MALAARREPELRELEREIEAAGGRASVYPLDVTSPEAVRSVVRAADDELDGLDCVIANAGVGRARWSGKLTWKDVEPLIRVNVEGATATLLAVIDRMVERKRGHLVGVTSLAGYRGLPKNAAYSGTKAYLTNFLEGLRVDLRSAGVAVTDVQPGFVRTPMTDKNDSPMPFILDASEAARIIARGIHKREAVVAFPWQLATVVRSASLLPPAIYDRAVSRARG
jgi:short-subunit dehydrogenase